MSSAKHILTVFHFNQFRYINDGPLVTEARELAVICGPEPVFETMAPGTAIELRLQDAPPGAGLTCFFLTYKPDLWQRPIGKVFRGGYKMPIGTELPSPLPSPVASVLVPRLLAAKHKPGYVEVERSIAAVDEPPMRTWRKL